jgi:hypothetical protein
MHYVCICKNDDDITCLVTGIGFTLYDNRVQGKTEISWEADSILPNYGCFCTLEHVSLLGEERKSGLRAKPFATFGAV